MLAIHLQIHFYIAQHGTDITEAVQIQFLQYGRDGNILELN